MVPGVLRMFYAHPLPSLPNVAGSKKQDAITVENWHCPGGGLRRWNVDLGICGVPNPSPSSWSVGLVGLLDVLPNRHGITDTTGPDSRRGYQWYPLIAVVAAIYQRSIFEWPLISYHMILSHIYSVHNTRYLLRWLCHFWFVRRYYTVGNITKW